MKGHRRALAAALVTALLAGSAPVASAIGFIDSPSAACRKVGKGNDCVITWYYMSVGASPNYIIDAWFLIDGALVSKVGGFFQQSMYLPAEQLQFPVKCGGAGGTPLPEPTPFLNTPPYGRSYAWTIRARDSAGLQSANYGTVVCPPRD